MWSSLPLDPIWIDVSITYIVAFNSTAFIIYVSTGGRDNWQWVVLSFISVTGRTAKETWALMMTVMDYATMTTTGNTKANLANQFNKLSSLYVVIFYHINNAPDSWIIKYTNHTLYILILRLSSLNAIIHFLGINEIN